VRKNVKYNQSSPTSYFENQETASTSKLEMDGPPILIIIHLILEDGTEEEGLPLKPMLGEKLLRLQKNHHWTMFCLTITWGAVCDLYAS